jgi:hypothetical protein
MLSSVLSRDNQQDNEPLVVTKGSNTIFAGLLLVKPILDSLIVESLPKENREEEF